MKLNLGCGHKKREGWVNVDKFASCRPDVVADLEQFPWPWESDSVDHIVLEHVLEHLGASSDTYLGIVREMWRVARHGCRIDIVVPHPRSDSYLIDPTHVRPIHPRSFEHFSRKMNDLWVRNGVPATPLAHYLGIDFDVASITLKLSPYWNARRIEQGMSDTDLQHAIETYSNVVLDCQIALVAVKHAPVP